MLTTDRPSDSAEHPADAASSPDAAQAADRVATPAPLSLPRLPLRAGDLSAWNALASHQDTPIVFGEITVTFGLQAALPAAHTQALVFRGRHGPLRLAITEFPVADLFGETFDADRLGSLPPALREAVRRAMVTALAEALPGSLGAALTVELVDGAAGDGEEVDVHVEIAGAFSAPVQLLLAGSPSVFLAVLGIDQLAALARHPGLAASIPLAASLRFGTTDLTVSEVRDLAPGDILLCPADVRTDALEIRLAGRVRALTRSDTGWIIGAERMDDPLPTPAGSETSDGLADLPIRLEFHVGEITLPLSAVESLAEGAVLPLKAVSVGGVRVTVRANGAAIAEGDLVQLDERLGVRLARVGAHREP